MSKSFVSVWDLEVSFKPNSLLLQVLKWICYVILQNAAIFWWNLHRNGEGDADTLHAGCPVLIGDKWGKSLWSFSTKTSPLKVHISLDKTREQDKTQSACWYMFQWQINGSMSMGKSFNGAAVWTLRSEVKAASATEKAYLRGKKRLGAKKGTAWVSLQLQLELRATGSPRCTVLCWRCDAAQRWERWVCRLAVALNAASLPWGLCFPLTVQGFIP